jgi:CubicO group peptidase (beta-lactamase class C family)
MNRKLSQWLIGAVAVLLLIPSLAGCVVTLQARPDAGAVNHGGVPPAPAGATSPGAGAAVDLSNVKPKPFDPQMQAELTAYITTLMQREQTPGVAVAVVQDGKVVYEQGFGVRELGKPDSVTPETLMMIGSTGKSMTTMMMATVVDDGKMGWDTPAIHIYPAFAVSDSKLTPKITMRHLVCNCTGVARRDVEMFFPTAPHIAEGMVEGLRNFSFAGPFGQSFQYSNQMVATGGYLAARAATAHPSNLYDDYIAQMQRRVFDPIGMTSTTFSFATVQANPNHATPHGLTAGYQLLPLSLQLEQPLQAVAPAGGSWSNVQDLARYLITQLHLGVASDGKRVVSATNLKVTWQPQVQSSPNSWYALGWGVGAYKGVRILTHNGGTSGFSSNLTFVPDANLGIAVLTNAQYASIPSAVFQRVLELAYGQPMEADARFVQRAAQAQQAIHDQLAQLPAHLDLTSVTPYQGAYINPSLGKVTLTLKDEKLILDTSVFTTELRSAGGEMYLIWDPPLTGMQVKFTQDTAGRHSFALISPDPDQPDTYLFTQVP